MSPAYQRVRDSPVLSRGTVSMAAAKPTVPRSTALPVPSAPARIPSEVWKGQPMPGRMGFQTVTVKNLKIVKVFEDKNIVLISGAIPGRKNTLITVCER